MGWRLGVRSLLTGLALFSAGMAAAEPGIFPDRIVFGQVAALDGPAKELGIDMRDGIRAAFAEANDAGGVFGRKLDLVPVDDGYEPRRSIEATQRLIAEQQTFALIGPVGTPTVSAARPVAEAAGMPIIGALSGADLLRVPFQRGIVNVRASDFQETEAMIERLATDLGITRVGILYEDDAFGRSAYEGVLQALMRRGVQIVSEGPFERNTTAVRASLLAIRRGDPQAVIMIGPYQPVAEFVRLARRIKFDPVLLAVSFVDADALAAELGAEGNGIVITQVVPFPGDNSSPLIRRYRAALRLLAGEAQPGFISLEGYIVGRFAIDLLKGLGPNPTRAGLLDAIYSRKTFDLDGLSLVYGADDNQGMRDVFVTAIRDGKVQPIGSLRELGR